MSRSAAAAAPPLPMGFKINPELSVIDNARAAWDKRKEVHHAQIENTARVQARHTFRDLLPDGEIIFRYDEGLYPNYPLFEIDDELIAYLPDRKEFALIEVCGGCAKQWQFNTFLSIADLGREITSRDAREPYQCRLCEAVERSSK